MVLMDLVMFLGVPNDQKARVARVLYEAFENKFKNIFGSEEQSTHIIAKHLRSDRTVVAVHEGAVVGVGGLRFERKGFLDISLLQVLGELGFGVFRVMFLGWIFYGKVEEKELLLETLAVERNMRGRGIGSHLINFIIDFARSRGYERVKLSVIDTNEKARRLFERTGFIEAKDHKIIFPWSKIFGFNRAIEMVYMTNQMSDH